MYVVEIQITGKIYFQNCCLQNVDGLTAVHDAQSEQKQEGEQYGGEKAMPPRRGTSVLWILRGSGSSKRFLRKAISRI